jgi:hypothetical protein
MASELTELLADITGIVPTVLKYGIRENSIAEKMSWAACRQTTRKEDESYCLLGIFDVNMPLLYGEGEKAFIRLQEEILKKSNDQSIFAHIMPHDEESGGLFARSPGFFKHSGDIAEFCQSEPSSIHASDTITVTKRGVRVQCTICSDPSDSFCLALLECYVGKSTVSRPSLFLEKYNGQYIRRPACLLIMLGRDSKGGRAIDWRGQMDYGSCWERLSKSDVFDDLSHY